NGVRVATFFDPATGQPASNYRATIDWGDGTQNQGVVQINPKGGFDVYYTGKVYQEGGPYTINVSVIDTATSISGSNDEVYTVLASPFVLTSPGAALTEPEGQSFTATIGSFVDTDFKQTKASDYTVTFDLGDGSTPVAGRVTATPGGAFNSYDVSVTT